MSDYGTISDDGTVRLERAFPIPVDQLWAHLTAPDGLHRWIAEGQIGPSRARLRFHDNGSLIDGAVTAWDPPALVEWGVAGLAGPMWPPSRARSSWMSDCYRHSDSNQTSTIRGWPAAARATVVLGLV
jgi:hypothetical protein